MKQRGFSLIELMVAVGILILINTMIFAKYPEFSQRMALKRTSEEIALIARQAQAYSLGIKRSASGIDNFFGFGVHFDKSPANSKSLILFTDSGSTPNKIYDAGDDCGGSSTECFQEFKIDTGDYVFELEECSSMDVCVSVSANTLDVAYPRASSVATINNDNSVSYAQVTVKSPDGNKEKKIKIWISGQITVE